MEKCAQDLGNSTKAVSSAIAQLLGEVAQGNENYAGMWAGPEMRHAVRRMGNQSGMNGGNQRQGLAVKVPLPFLPLSLSPSLPRYCCSGSGRWAAVTGPSR